MTQSEHDMLPGVILTRVDKFIGWARSYSLWQYVFGTACCAMEFMSVSSAHYDTDRFGAAMPRYTPRQADMLMVVGTITQKQGPVLRRIWEQMAEPKFVVAVGACAVSGGFYRNYATIQGCDRVIPVDVYVPGCPPRPEMILDGIMLLQEKIRNSKQAF